MTVALTVLGVFLSLVTPQTLEGLGAWAGPISGALVAAGAVIAGYLREDPLRQDTALSIHAREQARDVALNNQDLGGATGLTPQQQKQQDARFIGNDG